MKCREVSKYFLLITLCSLLFFAAHFAFAGGIRDSKHNLSSSLSKWPGNFALRAVEEREICVFCHTPHNAYPTQPLWNHFPSTATYTLYNSDTLQSPLLPIDGYSKLCLSCHDGTVAVGEVLTKWYDILMEITPCIDGSGRLVNGGAECTGYIGTDLSGGHPISIIFDEALKNQRNSVPGIFCKLNSPPNRQTELDVRIFPTQGGFGVQCSSCHDPHGGKGGAGAPPMWRKATLEEVCNVCHENGCTYDFDF
jgi:hypothetical protein